MTGLGLPTLPLSRFSDSKRNDGGYAPTTRRHVGDLPAHGRVVEHVRELRPQVSNAHLFGHGGMVPERPLMYTGVHVEAD